MGGRFAIKSESRVFTDLLREKFKKIIDPTASFLLKTGLTPNMVTLIGCVGHIGAAFLAASGRFTWAGLVILLTAPMDALDGAMARQKGANGKFGAFFDSVIDRYSELFLYGGLMVYYASHGDVTGSLLVYFAMMGSIMVSYTRARAESLGFSAKIGLLSRVERYIILVPSLIFRWLYIGLGILAVFTNYTAVQRILSVNKQASEAVSPDKP
ncbi:MAG: CDP-alcohol phosphatidyltransferase family protein [Chloroflexi bacterium]|nr:CDP-alcohol phosphatidyltransferase family protein [Chloroflexota bacterium]